MPPHGKILKKGPVRKTSYLNCIKKTKIVRDELIIEGHASLL
jgi:hypothetical protein